MAPGIAFPRRSSTFTCNACGSAVNTFAVWPFPANAIGETGACCTVTVTVLLVSPAANVTVPVGKLPPLKSAALTLLPGAAATVQVALLAPLVLPVRVTVKVKGVVPLFPSG